MAGDTCDVCGRSGVVGVASSALGPCSWAYCRECLNKPADVAAMFAATIDGCNGSANVADWVKELWTWEDGGYVSWGDFAAKHEAAILADAAARDAQAIEARRAETGTGSVHESAVGNADAPGKGQP